MDGYLLLFSGLSPKNNKNVTLCDLCGFAVKKWLLLKILLVI